MIDSGTAACARSRTYWILNAALDELRRIATTNELKGFEEMLQQEHPKLRRSSDGG
jgi:hypothetical protein